MKCENCPALANNEGHEHSADEWWCMIGEDMESYYKEEDGCKRRSIAKIQKAIEEVQKIEAKQYGDMFEYFKKLESNENLIILYSEIQNYIGKTVYRICPKCNPEQTNCKKCAWEMCSKFNGCDVYGLWSDGSYPKEQCFIKEAKLSWNWLPSFIENLNTKTFFSLEEAKKILGQGRQ